MNSESGPKLSRRDVLKAGAGIAATGIFGRQAEVSAAPKKIELPSYTGEEYTSPNYPYTIVVPDEWVAKTLEQDGKIIADNFLGRNPAPDMIFTDVRLRLESTPLEVDLDNYADAFLQKEWLPKGAHSVIRSELKIDHGRIDTLELAAFVPGTDTFPEHERRAFFFSDGKILGKAVGRYSLDPAVNGNEYARFFDMMTLSFHLTNRD